MDKQELIRQLEYLGTVTFCDIIENTNRYAIGMTVNIENENTLDSFDNIVNVHVIPSYSTVIDKVFESGSIKAVFE
jgi:hypothetical protein